MLIAVTYDNGSVFQHFGRTEQFKLYEVRDGQVLSSEVVGTGGEGHEALAGVLSSYGVDLLICGGLGDGAQAALADAGIVVFSGAEGDADEAVAAFLRGELVSQGVNCDHHDHEHPHDESDELDFSGGGCGGCASSGCASGGCGGCSGCGPQILYDGPNAGKVCRVHYTGTFNDGTTFDSSYRRGEPLEFICAVGMMIPGFDRAVCGMAPGDVVDIHLMPEEAYGMPSEDLIITLPISMLPDAEQLKVGDQVVLYNPAGQQFPSTVVACDESSVTFDANHEMAGKELNFRIELLEVLE
ncbi:MAG: FKBP-type peptidyl-prolyl cis-trans isomerase [Mogibacterium sp.]|nr:FKBP-type peptidyl-prolyl cis-trans isomerase [Mogibacterium sp.]